MRITDDHRAEVRRIAAEAVAKAKAEHQAWHNLTGLTACPWGCGDGSGIADGRKTR